MNNCEYYASLLSESNEELYGTPAEESLSSILGTVGAIGSKVTKSAMDSFSEIAETIAANIIVLSKNLEGYKIHKDSAELVNKIIDLFEKLVDDCTYTYEKIYRGWTTKDVEKGVKLFSAQMLSSKDRHQSIIRIANSMVKKHVDILSYSKLDPNDFLDHEETVKLIKRLLKLSAYVRSCSKKTRIDFFNKMQANSLGLGDYATRLIDTNKQEIAQIGAILLSTFGKIYVRPDNGIQETNIAVARAMNQFAKDSKQLFNAADMVMNGTLV